MIKINFCNIIRLDRFSIVSDTIYFWKIIFLTSRLSKVAVFIALFGAADLSDVWWAAIKFFRELILWALPILCWCFIWVSMTLLTVVQESYVTVKLFLIELLKFDCVSGDGIKIGAKRCRILICTLLTVATSSVV